MRKWRITSSNNTDNDNQKDPKSKPLSAGAIAGIVVGCVVFVAFAAVGVAFLVRSRIN